MPAVTWEAIAAMDSRAAASSDTMANAGIASGVQARPAPTGGASAVNVEAVPPPAAASRRRSISTRGGDGDGDGAREPTRRRYQTRSASAQALAAQPPPLVSLAARAGNSERGLASRSRKSGKQSAKRRRVARALLAVDVDDVLHVEAFTASDSDGDGDGDASCALVAADADDVLHVEAFAASDSDGDGDDDARCLRVVSIFVATVVADAGDCPRIEAVLADPTVPEADGEGDEEGVGLEVGAVVRTDLTTAAVTLASVAFDVLGEPGKPGGRLSQDWPCNTSSRRAMLAPRPLSVPYGGESGDAEAAGASLSWAPLLVEFDLTLQTVDELPPRTLPPWAVGASCSNPFSSQCKVFDLSQNDPELVRPPSIGPGAHALHRAYAYASHPPPSRTPHPPRPHAPHQSAPQCMTHTRSTWQRELECIPSDALALLRSHLALVAAFATVGPAVHTATAHLWAAPARHPGSVSAVRAAGGGHRPQGPWRTHL